MLGPTTEVDRIGLLWIGQLKFWSQKGFDKSEMNPRPCMGLKTMCICPCLTKTSLCKHCSSTTCTGDRLQGAACSTSLQILVGCLQLLPQLLLLCRHLPGTAAGCWLTIWFLAYITRTETCTAVCACAYVLSLNWATAHSTATGMHVRLFSLHNASAIISCMPRSDCSCSCVGGTLHATALYSDWGVARC